MIAYVDEFGVISSTPPDPNRKTAVNPDTIELGAAKNMSVLGDLDPEIVEKIEVVKTPYLTGDLILHGIVNVITRSGDFSNITMPDYTVVLPYRVIDQPDTFIAPEYPDKKNSQNRIPDLRNTLYWNPSVKTDMNGEALTEFWTSDLPGTYIINIQGISAAGEKISLKKSFVVR